MKKREIILLLEEGLSIEEIPTLTNLNELEELIDKANLDRITASEIKKRVSHLKKETINHAKIFSKDIKLVAKSKNEF